MRAFVCLLTFTAGTALLAPFPQFADGSEQNPSRGDRSFRKKQGKTSSGDQQAGQSASAAKKRQAGRKETGTEKTVPPQLRVEPEVMYYGPLSYAATGPRYFAARLQITNQSNQPVTLKRDGIRLQVGAKTVPLKPVDSRYRYSDIYIGTKRYQLGTLKSVESLTIRPGQSAFTWVLFGNVSNDHDVPAMKLLLKFDRSAIALDINEQAERQLALTAERIGPRGSLGLLTISGQLNTVNVQHLVDVIDQLTRGQSKVLRFVIRWEKSAGRLNPRLQSWLLEQAQRATQPAGISFPSYPYPTFPAAVRKLHLSRIPGYTVPHNGQSGSSAALRYVHSSDLEAVTFALSGAYHGLSLKDLLQEIKQGTALTRAAALINGADRLPADQLPLLLQYIDDDSHPQLQRAALIALRHFGEPAALKKLAAIAARSGHALQSTALESLAASRFAAAHRKLLEIFRKENAAGKKQVIRIMAAHPRRLWSDPLYEFLQQSDSDRAVEALRALAVIGHSRLPDLLEKALKSRHEALRQEAFRQLVSRSDARSERLALDYTLEVLKVRPPDAQMISLLNRTKDRRAIPLLLNHLSRDAGNKYQLIQLLSQIGDQTTGDELVQSYRRMKSDNDKAALLRALVRLKSPRLLSLAAEALRSGNSALASAACDCLRADASPQAVQLLIEALEKATDSNTWVYTSSSLAQIGTSQARTALIRLRDNPKTPANKKRYVVNALKSLWQRSPAYQYLYRAWHSLKERQDSQTLQFCDMALKLDPQQPWAYSCRGHVLIRQKKWTAAQNDLQHAEQIDPYDPYAVTGNALILVHKGEWRKAVEKIEQRKNDFSSDRIFPYHAARVCSQAAVLARKSSSAQDRQQAVRLEQKAIGFLETAVKLGRSSSNGYKTAHIRSEPDFAPLHQRDDYKQLVGKGKTTSQPADRKKQRAR